MKLILPLEAIEESDRGVAGGKAFALGRLLRERVPAPRGVCVLTRAYREYVRRAGLLERILLELNRKPFSEMRWEELWDAALRIRNMFLNTPIPDNLAAPLRDALRPFSDAPVAVRSTAPEEDAAGASFAGLHESYVNVRGLDAIIERVRLVWASLWSDAALLYRRELKLDPARSAMAVIVQEFIVGERSGIAFSRSPTGEEQAVVESVYGLNQALVDGTVEPDRWTLDRQDGRILSHTPAGRESAMRADADGVRIEPLAPEERSRPPLDSGEVQAVYRLARRLESLFGPSQDVEWTWGGERLVALQSRPVTTGGDADEKRAWYLSLRRSYENLEGLRRKIEEEEIPAMIREAETLAQEKLDELDDVALAGEIARRRDILDRWTRVYWDDFIPFAHGARLFGQMYNDAVRPADPFEFVDLLRPEGMASTDRNERLEALAGMLRDRPDLAETSGDAGERDRQEFERQIESFLADYGNLTGGEGGRPQGRERLVRLLQEMAAHPEREASTQGRTTEEHIEAFLSKFGGAERERAAQLLDLARASYRLRDEDNIYLGAVERQLERAAAAGRERIAQRGGAGEHEWNAGQVVAALRGEPIPEERDRAEVAGRARNVRARQITGQPAGPGVVTAPARVITDAKQLFDFRKGEVLVCDAVDPNMTFVVPLASAVVERRGGMLIHGAIIAREYGLPCVTGVPAVVEQVRTGDRVTVDGFLGIVTIQRGRDEGDCPTK